MGKKDLVPCMFGCNYDRLFPKKYTVKFSFCPKARVNTERVPPGHSIILLKSNKLYMAAVSVKRYITKLHTCTSNVIVMTIFSLS